jgi:hypothetical protein
VPGTITVKLDFGADGSIDRTIVITTGDVGTIAG